MTTAGDRILAAGVPIVLGDGREVRLRFSNRSVKMLEDEFGSLAAMQGALGDTDNPDRKVIGPICTVLTAGLLHEGLSFDDVLDLTEPKLLSTYSQAIATAFAQAFGTDDPGAAAEGKAPSPSTGPSGTTSQPVATDVAMTSSGT